MLGIQRAQLRRRLRERAPGVMLEMPVLRDDRRQERVERPFVVEQAPVEDPRIPIVQDVSDVEDDRRRMTAANQPWRALKRRFVLLMTYVRPRRRITRLSR